MNSFTGLLIRYYFQIISYLVFFASSLFFPSGTLKWKMGWIYLAINALSMVLNSMILILRNPELFRERAIRKGKRNWDRALAGLMTFFGPISICIVAGFNHRHHWLPQISIFLQMTGIVIMILGCILAAWAIYSNKFFYGFLRIAEKEGHLVCTSGAYKIVRHPSYLGGFLIELATPLILNSVWAFIPAVLTAFAVLIRTKLEDDALTNNLKGYQSYALKVRYRLLPFVW